MRRQVVNEVLGKYHETPFMKPAGSKKQGLGGKGKGIFGGYF